MADNCCAIRTPMERDRTFASSIARRAMELALSGNLTAAQSLSTAAFSLLEVGGGGENAEGCLVYTWLAFVPYKQDGAEKSLPLWEKALSIATAVHGELHVATAMARSNLGQIHIELQDIETGTELITQAWNDLAALPPTEEEAELIWRAQVTEDTRQAMGSLQAA